MFNDLLYKTKGFKYQITVKILFKIYKSTEIELSQVYFNSITETVTNHQLDFENASREISYNIERWVNEGSGWIIENIHSQDINISTFKSLSGSLYIKLPAELKNLKRANQH